MTAIEMQEYMGVSRSKTYDLVWSGEIDSYRLGRKLLVSRAAVDAYIESRSGRRAVTSTGTPFPPPSSHGCACRARPSIT
ncbi:helix-turn-helix domain-containing protein [Collinsella aerofaciens]|nr:helix-turn-helix domain-containing protein [Collinsella aerofaciens]MDB1829493.1 helix-turn-helix domain-containing protein [Collinsella aerofaciens]